MRELQTLDQLGKKKKKTKLFCSRASKWDEAKKGEMVFGAAKSQKRNKKGARRGASGPRKSAVQTKRRREDSGKKGTGKKIALPRKRAVDREGKIEEKLPEKNVLVFGRVTGILSGRGNWERIGINPSPQKHLNSCLEELKKSTLGWEWGLCCGVGIFVSKARSWSAGKKKKSLPNYTSAPSLAGKCHEQALTRKKGGRGGHWLKFQGDDI